MQRSLKFYLPEWAQDWLEVIVPGLQLLLIVIAVVIPNYVRYRMEQKRSNDSVPNQNPARSAPRKKKRSKKR